MATITVELPDAAVAALPQSEDGIAPQMRLAASLFWYSRGVISQERAAEIAGLTRVQFIDACGRNEVEAIAIDLDEVSRELTRE